MVLDTNRLKMSPAVIRRRAAGPAQCCAPDHPHDVHHLSGRFSTCENGCKLEQIHGIALDVEKGINWSAVFPEGPGAAPRRDVRKFLKKELIVRCKKCALAGPSTMRGTKAGRLTGSLNDPNVRSVSMPLQHLQRLVCLRTTPPRGPVSKLLLHVDPNRRSVPDISSRIKFAGCSAPWML